MERLDRDKYELATSLAMWGGHSENHSRSAKFHVRTIATSLETGGCQELKEWQKRTESITKKISETGELASSRGAYPRVSDGSRMGGGLEGNSAAGFGI